MTNEMAEVILQPSGRMGDQLCPRCGTKFEVDFFCENGHAKPRPTNEQKSRAAYAEHVSSVEEALPDF